LVIQVIVGKRSCKQPHSKYDGRNYSGYDEDLLNFVRLIVGMLHIAAPSVSVGGSAAGDLITDKSHGRCGDATPCTITIGNKYIFQSTGMLRRTSKAID
jgi:hypothetical protein